MSEEIRMWADAFGTWYASVPVSACDLVSRDPELIESRLEDMARDAIIGELAARDNPAGDAVRAASRLMWVVLIPEESSPERKVYRESWPDDNDDNEESSK